LQANRIKLNLNTGKRQIPDRIHNNKNKIENGKRRAMIHSPHVVCKPLLA
jgi:hypothetical protein